MIIYLTLSYASCDTLLEGTRRGPWHWAEAAQGLGGLLLNILMHESYHCMLHYSNSWHLHNDDQYCHCFEY